MNLAPVLKFREFDANGNPLAGGKVYSYVAGTTTPQATYSDAAGTANTNPVVLDANGRADIWLDPSLAYKFTVTDSDDVTQYTIDNVYDPVETDDIEDEAVTTSKIADEAVTAAKLDDEAVTTAKLNDGSVTGAKLDSSVADGISIELSGTSLRTRHLYESRVFQANGAYSSASSPQSQVDGYFLFPFDATITAVWIYNLTRGASGTTEFDLKLAPSSPGTFASILTTTGKIDNTSDAGGNVWTDSGSVVAAQTGVTKPVLSSANVSAGNAIRFDIITAMVGASDCGMIVQFVPR